MLVIKNRASKKIKLCEQLCRFINLYIGATVKLHDVIRGLAGYFCELFCHSWLFETNEKFQSNPINLKHIFFNAHFLREVFCEARLWPNELFNWLTNYAFFTSGSFFVSAFVPKLFIFSQKAVLLFDNLIFK